jgi:hypothetical protein
MATVFMAREPPIGLFRTRYLQFHRNLLGVISASQSGWNRVTLRNARFIFRFTIERVPGLDSSSQWPHACQTFFAKSLCRLDACGILRAGAIENHITISGKIAMPSDHFFH